MQNRIWMQNQSRMRNRIWNRMGNRIRNAEMDLYAEQDPDAEPDPELEPDVDPQPDQVSYSKYIPTPTILHSAEGDSVLCRIAQSRHIFANILAKSKPKSKIF
jgi:hypothetical protein